MAFKFIVVTFVTVACMASQGYADKPNAFAKTNEAAAARAFEEGMIYRSEGKEKEAQAAFKMAAQYYRDAGKQEDAARMERLVNKTGSVQEKLNERFAEIDQHLRATDEIPTTD